MERRAAARRREASARAAAEAVARARAQADATRRAHEEEAAGYARRSASAGASRYSAGPLGRGGGAAVSPAPGVRPGPGGRQPTPPFGGYRFLGKRGRRGGASRRLSPADSRSPPRGRRSRSQDAPSAGRSSLGRSQTTRRGADGASQRRGSGSSSESRSRTRSRTRWRSRSRSRSRGRGRRARRRRRARRSRRSPSSSSSRLASPAASTSRHDPSSRSRPRSGSRSGSRSAEARVPGWGRLVDSPALEQVLRRVFHRRHARRLRGVFGPPGVFTQA